MLIRDRIKELRRVKASELRPNPKNWKSHPQSQRDAVRGALSELGYCDALLARELSDGSIMLIDGHCRAEETPDADVPVLILDVDEADADKILLTLDPLTNMAEANAAKLEELMREVETGSEALAAMLDELAQENGIVDQADGEWPDVEETTERSFIVRYAPDEEDLIRSFVGVDELPTNGIGKLVLERIKAIAAH